MRAGVMWVYWRQILPNLFEFSSPETEVQQEDINLWRLQLSFIEGCPLLDSYDLFSD